MIAFPIEQSLGLFAFQAFCFKIPTCVLAAQIDQLCYKKNVEASRLNVLFLHHRSKQEKNKLSVQRDRKIL
ncbi:MAG: hypothetical protein DBX44_04755 [Oscillospiraceae bacterium]|nr:MAG: hypothetical protein DBX44_04755 [Oscillospiraceae bacterium]